MRRRDDCLNVTDFLAVYSFVKTALVFHLCTNLFPHITILYINYLLVGFYW